LEVPQQELISRISSRGEGREDDTTEKAKVRLVVYENQTTPVKKYYKEKGIYTGISGVGNIDEIFTRIKNILDRAA